MDMELASTDLRAVWLVVNALGGEGNGDAGIGSESINGEIGGTDTGAEAIPELLTDDSWDNG